MTDLQPWLEFSAHKHKRTSIEKGGQKANKTLTTNTDAVNVHFPDVKPASAKISNCPSMSMCRFIQHIIGVNKKSL